MLGDPEGAVAWGRRAVEEREWAESYVALAFAHQGAATRRGEGERRHWERAAHYARVAIALPPTSVSATTMSLNPLDRSFVAPSVLSAALRAPRHDDPRGPGGGGEGAGGRPGGPGAPDQRARLRGRGDEGGDQAAEGCARGSWSARPRGWGRRDWSARAVVADVRRRAGVEPVRTPGRYDVAFMCGWRRSQWNPHIAATAGIGGSETAVIEVAKRLAKRGPSVRVYCNSVVEMVEDDVRYLPVERFAPEPCDVLVGWRQAQFVHVAEARVRWTWVHDIVLPGIDDWAVHRTDRVLGLSGWHVAGRSPPRGSTSRRSTRRPTASTTRASPRRGAERDPKRVVFSSSPSRGLGELPDDSGRIVRAEVPGAELHPPSTTGSSRGRRRSGGRATRRGWRGSSTSKRGRRRPRGWWCTAGSTARRSRGR